LSAPLKGMPPGLARVRKDIPPPGKVFKDTKGNSRQRSKEKLRQESKESFLRKSS
jgi:hypothetical protein